MTEPLALRPAEPRDARAFARFVARHVAESGRDGAPTFAPMVHVREEEAESGAHARWERRIDEPNFARAFLLCAGAEVVGHLELKGGRIAAELHRLSLGMGILRPHVGKGQGQRLIEHALAWARAKHFGWVDLGVFEGNEPAQRLYLRNGFAFVGKREDAFRLPNGTRITDLLMTLSLDARRSAPGPAPSGRSTR